MKKIFLIIFLVSCSQLYSQSYPLKKRYKMGIRTGLSVGAPIPNKFEKGEDGELGIGPLIGIFTKYYYSPKLYVEANLYYDSRGNSPYSKQYRRDTSVQFGSMNTLIPTFYNAWVSGEIKLSYLTLPINASWFLKKWFAVQLGSQINYLLYASDKGTAKIIVGEGGVVDDIYRNFENAVDIHKWDYGGNAGVCLYFLPELEFQIRYNKSIRSIYRKGFFSDNNFEERKFLNTHLQAAINYQIK